MGKRKTNIKKVYNSNLKSDLVNVPFVFYKEMYNAKLETLLNAPILAFRIINKILNDTSYDQFSIYNMKQQNLFKNYEKTFLSEDNSYAQFSFKTTELDRSYDQIEKALVFLSQINSGVVKLYDSKGKSYKTASHFLSEFTIKKGKISFVVPSYWMSLILRLDDNKKTHYNKQLQDIPLFISNVRMFLIYQWILSIGKDGTKVNWLEFQKKYNYSYKTKDEFIRNVFGKLKLLMNKNASKSFNYKSKGDIIYISVFDISSTQIELKKDTSQLLKAKEKANYWRNRHKLNNEMYIVLFKWLKNKDSYLYLEQSYALFKKDLRIHNKEKPKDKKKKLSDFTDIEFFRIFQFYIKKHYQQTIYANYRPNAYIKIYDEKKREIIPFPIAEE